MKAGTTLLAIATGLLLMGCQAQHHSIGEAKVEAQKHQKVRVRVNARVMAVDKTVAAIEDPLAPQTVTLSDGTGSVRVDFLARDLARPLEAGDRVSADIELTAPWFLANDRTRHRSPATAVQVWSITEG